MVDSHKLERHGFGRFLGPRATTSVNIAGPRLVELARTLPHVLTLGRGDPDLPTPPHVLAAAEEAPRAGRTGYTPLRGLEKLRHAIAAKLRRENGLNVDPEREVLVTTGSQEAVMVTALTMLGPGDEWILPDPYYFSYVRAVEYAGGRVVRVPTFAQDGFEPDPDRLERSISERTKAIVLLTPHNPTGTVYSRWTVERIAEIVLRRDLMVISDEIYEHQVFDGHEHVSIASLPGMADRTITINGFSKSYQMTGWRVGYMSGPEEFLAAAVPIRHTLSICAPTVSQYAATAALTGPQDCVHETLLAYSDRRAAFTRHLERMNIPFTSPRGTFYVFADISQAGMTSEDFCFDLLRKAGVLILPGSDFGQHGEGFVRFSLLAPVERLLEGLERVEAYLRHET